MAGLPRRAGRPRQLQHNEKRTTFGTRLRPELRDYLAAQAAGNGRSMSEEIEDRLETSRMADDAWGGARVVALLRILAAIAAEHRGWLDDHAAFELVRNRWLAALNEREPPLPAEARLPID